MSSDDVVVRGGAASLDANLDDLTARARLLQGAGGTLLGLSDDVGLVALHPAIAEAGILCPDLLPWVEGAILAATTGPHGLFPIGTALLVTADLVTGAVAAYRLADHAATQLLDRLSEAGGFALGMALPALGPALALSSGAAVVGNPVLAARLAAEAVTGTLDDDVLGALYAHPWMLEAATRAAPGLVQGTAFSLGSLDGGPAAPGALALTALTGGRWPSADYESAVGGLLALGQLTGRFRDTGGFTTVPVGEARDYPGLGGTPVRQIFRGQDELAGREAALSVIRIDAGDGRPPAFIVQIPGTQDWSPVRTDNPVDLTTNLTLMADRDSVMEQQVRGALVDAGADSTTPVMLTGHSQGGITAAALASDPDFRATFDVRSVVTGGSPIARFPIPEDVSVLSVEHTQDPVPKLDGLDNPVRDNWITATRSLTPNEGTSPGSTTPNPGAAHDVRDYARTGAELDASTSPSMEAWRRENAQFFAPGSTTTYQIVPDPAPRSAP